MRLYFLGPLPFLLYFFDYPHKRLQIDTVNGLARMRSAKGDTREEADAGFRDIGLISFVGRSSALKRYDVQFIAGEGSYSTVYAATEKNGNRRVAIKALSKAQLVKLNKTKYAYVERDIYRRTSHPAILNLYDSLQDDEYLYFILEYAPNHDLRHYIRALKVFSLDTARFYVAEIISGVNYLHQNNIVHRDLKPENILFDSNMHVKV